MPIVQQTTLEDSSPKHSLHLHPHKEAQEDANMPHPKPAQTSLEHRRSWEYDRGYTDIGELYNNIHLVGLKVGTRVNYRRLLLRRAQTVTGEVSEDAV